MDRNSSQNNIFPPTLIISFPSCWRRAYCFVTTRRTLMDWRGKRAFQMEGWSKRTAQWARVPVLTANGHRRLIGLGSKCFRERNQFVSVVVWSSLTLYFSESPFLTNSTGCLLQIWPRAICWLWWVHPWQFSPLQVSLSCWYRIIFMIMIMIILWGWGWMGMVICRIGTQSKRKCPSTTNQPRTSRPLPLLPNGVLFPWCGAIRWLW